MRNARRVWFWAAASALTLLNIGIWTISGLLDTHATRVKIAYATSAGELEYSGRVDIRFDRDIFATDTNEAALPSPPFHLEPDIDGNWVCPAADTIAFEPDAPPPPGRRYRVLPVDGHPLFDRIDIDPQRLPTLDYMPLRCSHAFLVHNEVAPANPEATDAPSRVATIEIRFNQPVSKDDLLEHLHTLIDGNAADVTHIGKALHATHRIDVPCNPGDALTLTLAEGLTGHGAQLGLAKDEAHHIAIPRGLHLVRIGANASYWRTDEPFVNFYFDRRLNPAQTQPAITVTPPIGALRVVTSGNSITVNGPFIHGTEYTLTLQPPLLALDGSTLATTIQRTVHVPPARPQLSFPAYSGRIGSKGAFEVDLKAHGVQHAKLRIHRLLDQHIPVFLSGVMSNYEVPDLGTLVSETTIDLPTEPLGSAVNMALSLEHFMDRLPGVYWITIESTDRRWTRDSMLLQVGDLGLDVHTDRSGILAWVTHVDTAHAAGNVQVIAYGNNRVELARGTTDADGMARLNLDLEQCALVTATQNGELAYVHIDDAVALSDRSLAGAKWAGPLDLALYADRGVHRPGETIHMTGVVRTDTGQVPDTIPLELRLTRPDKRVVLSETVLTDADQGMFQLDLPTRPDDPTGNWIVSMHVPGSDEAIASLACPVMPFMPVRLNVKTSPIDSDADGDVLVEASYLHGAPAQGLAATCATTFQALRYTDNRFPDHRFEDPPTTRRVERTTTATLNDAGRQTFNIRPPDQPGTWRGDVQATVIERGGRATTARTRINRHTADVHLGVLAVDGSLHGTDAAILIDAVVMDGQGHVRTSTPLEAHLLSIDHEWNLVDAGRGKRRWKSVELAQPVQNVNPAFTPGPANTYTCTIPALPTGTYRLTANVVEQGGTSPATVSLDLHVSDGAARGRMAADRPDRLELIVQDKTVRPGMSSSVLIRSGFPGVALFTVETDSIKHWELIDIDGDGVRVPFTVPADMRDTCFVAATVLRPLDPTRTQWLPLRARGAARLQVDKRVHVVDLEVDAVTSASPGETVAVRVRAPQVIPLESDPVDVGAPEDLATVAVIVQPASRAVHLWAVDEGALLATAWTEPDLIDYFLRDRRRYVAAVGTTEQLLPDFERPVTIDRIGGDRAGRFREPVPIRQPETAVLWHSVTPLAMDGVFNVDLVMPDIDGAMRVMAVVVDGDTYGHANHLVAVQAPLQLSAATPRAAAPGDVMSIPVRVVNGTAEDVAIELALTTNAALEGKLSADFLNVPANSEATTTLHMEAASIGEGEVLLTATPLQQSAAVEPARMTRSIAVRPPHGRQRHVHRMLVAPGETVPINRDRSLEALAGHVDIVVGGLPTIDLKPVFDALVGYPYGCAEQTGSRVQGLLAALLLPEAVSGTSPKTLRAWTRAGLERLHWMQRGDGSIPYWQGGRANDWVTLRTALLALEARAQGVEPPELLLEGLLGHAARIARAAQRNGQNAEAAFACRVLARGDAPDAALLATLASNPSALDLASRAHLADACAAVGDMDTADALLTTFSLPGKLLPRDAGWMTSDVKQAAVALSVLVQIAPEHAIGPDLARYIDESRSVRGWRTTYENAEAIAALAKWNALQQQEGIAQGIVRIAGETIELDGNAPVHLAFDVEPGQLQDEVIESTGDGPITLLVSISGVPTGSDTLPVLQDTIQIERTWTNAAGEVLAPGAVITAGDLVIVDLEVVSKSGSAFRNVAIVDVLPGGMEFELPALATSAKINATKVMEVDRAEFRDDRLLAFATVNSKPRRLRYLMRAIVPGTWAVPAPDAMAMYDADAHGRGAAGRVEIVLP